MHQPLGYRDPDQPNHVRLSKKSIYGHQQAPRAWYQRFADYVSSSDFCHSTFDYSLFIYHKGSETADLLTYVDDIILTGSPHALCKFFWVLLLHDMQAVCSYSEKYATEIIERVGMYSCKPSPTLVDTKPKLRVDSIPLYEDPSHYHSLARVLQYLTFTRSYIFYVIQQVCLFMHDPQDIHMHALNRILCYAKGTLDHGLHLYPSSVHTLISYTYAD